MSPNFSKPRQKQRLDFYLERIHGLCKESIESGQLNDSDSPLKIIKEAVHALEQNEQRTYAARIQELESIKSNLRNVMS